MGIIELKGMKFFAHHGCFSEERTIGNYFVVDFSIEADLDAAGESDALEDTLNYQRIYDIVKEEMAVPSNLLEHVSARILKRCRSVFPAAGRMTVSVSKLNPPLGGEVAASRVTMHSER